MTYLYYSFISSPLSCSWCWLLEHRERHRERQVKSNTQDTLTSDWYERLIRWTDERLVIDRNLTTNWCVELMFLNWCVELDEELMRWTGVLDWCVGLMRWTDALNWCVELIRWDWYDGTDTMELVREDWCVELIRWNWYDGTGTNEDCWKWREELGRATGWLTMTDERLVIDTNTADKATNSIRFVILCFGWGGLRNWVCYKKTISFLSDFLLLGNAFFDFREMYFLTSPK